MPSATRQSFPELLSPSALAEIENYQLLAKVAVEGFIAGFHRSLQHGTGSEFLQYRNYVPGDDPKLVDWQLYARLDRLHTKVFQEETNMNCVIVLDASASMDYQGSRAPVSKLRYAAMLAACLTYLASRQSDNVGLYVFGERIQALVPPARRTGQLARIFGQLNALRANGSANLDSALPLVAEGLRDRGLVVLLSDFLSGESALAKRLRHLRFARHEVVAFHILDPDELDIPFERTTRFVDSESGDSLMTYPETFRDDYRQAVSAHCERIRLACEHAEADVQLTRSDAHLGNALAAYLHRRGRCGPW